MNYTLEKVVIFVVFCFGIGIRAIVSLSSYSGALTPPMFGDYEAQRHWQEITYNLPTNEWYINTTNNNLLYWGIDYPPLTAYHSYLLSIVASRVNSSYVTLFQSRGYESHDHKSFMRLSVLLSDLCIYLPAITLAIISLKWFTSTVFILPYLLLVLYPGQILVDNGHFQYNNTSLGLFLFAVACVMQSQYIWSSFFFTLALNYKQMELYHALPFFVYLLKACFLEKVTFRKIIRLIQLGFVTLTTFFLLWMPWISSLDSLTSTILRLFPLKRGVFEDKVANVWCTFNAVYNLKENFHNEQMALICLVATLFAILPSNVHLYFKFQKEIFLCSLANTSISFFLFSYQVHEKSILLAAIPVCFLFNSLLFLVLCFLKISILSLFPLLIKDNLCVIYFCMIILYMLLFKFILQLNYCKNEKANISLRLFMDLFDVSILIISTATLLISPPARFPYIWSFFISSLSCIYFTFFLCASNLFQYYLFEPYGCFRYFIDVGLKYMQ